MRGHASRRWVDPVVHYLNRSVRLDPVVRVLLASAVLLWGIALLGCVYVLIVMPQGTAPHTTIAWLITFFVTGLGCEMIVVGLRLLLAGDRSGDLIGPAGRTICGLFFGASAVWMDLITWESASAMPAIVAVGIGVFSFLIFRSATSNEDD